MGVTILDIARHLGLSHTTVSRVLNGRQSSMVSQATQERVRRMADELGYRPNLAARSLRDTNSNLVGVFGSPFSGVWGHGMPEIVRGLSAVLHRAEYDVFFAFSEPHDERDTMPAWRFDGAVVAQAPTPETLAQLRRSHQPFVCVNERLPNASAVVPDEAQGVRLALAHFAELGHRKIAYAGAADWHFEHFSLAERRDAFVQCADDMGLAVVTGAERAEGDGRDRTGFLRQAVVEERATAILAYDHFVGLDIMSSAAALGLRVPEDVSLICFNDDPLLSHVRPAVTTLRLDGEAMGRQAAEVLLAMLDGTAPDELCWRVPLGLTVRETTAASREAGR